MKYKIAEVFYSIKGEGYWTGTPMAFIRLSGCNLSCKFCDTDHSNNFQYDEEELLELVKAWPAQRVVITGGEPLSQDISPLIDLLKTNGYALHLETNGTIKRSWYSRFDWVAISPKSIAVAAELVGVRSIDEIKILWGMEDWEEMAECAKLTACDKQIMPLAKPLDVRVGSTDEGIILDNIRGAVNYAKENPEFVFCPQLHKLCGFR